MTLPEVGSLWERPSLVWGSRLGSGAAVVQESPLGFKVQESTILTVRELEQVFGESGVWNRDEMGVWVSALATHLKAHRPEFIEALRVSTGFVVSDCEEVFDATVEYVASFQKPPAIHCPSIFTSNRELRIEEVPWGTVAAVLPQNAFFSLALTVMLNAWATGNRAVLRAPSGGLRLAAMLAEICIEAGVPSPCLSIVLADAREFIVSWVGSRDHALLHFMGGSERAPELLERSWSAGKPLLIDGTGNTYVYVDADQGASYAAELLWKGSIRYNGETCTSINGAVVHPDLIGGLETELRKHVDICRYGCDLNAEVGPLFTKQQAAAMRLLAERSGGIEHRAGNDSENVFAPTLVVEPRLDSEMVRVGMFAPAIWIASGTWDDFERIWNENRYPLCAGVLSNDLRVLERARILPSASRAVINGDPSIEDPREPWGAYPQCGVNPVGEWFRKYLRTVQVDVPWNG